MYLNSYLLCERTAPEREKMTLTLKASGPAVEACYCFLLWLIPTVEKFPRSQKFLLGHRIQVGALDGREALIETSYTCQIMPGLTGTGQDAFGAKCFAPSAGRYQKRT